MKLVDILVNTEERFSIEKDIESGKCYLSFPVFNGLAEYSEFYKLSQTELDEFLKNKDALRDFVKQCKGRQKDDRLLMKPGRLRGEPC